ncbi:hypothetical protein XENTR_v10016034 [Xenopus tropicalis]|nr:hypothetical protein XENTR_v10016034 [Xenopus tropicalis]
MSYIYIHLYKSDNKRYLKEKFNKGKQNTSIIYGIGEVFLFAALSPLHIRINFTVYNFSLIMNTIHFAVHWQLPEGRSVYNI